DRAVRSGALDGDYRQAFHEGHILRIGIVKNFKASAEIKDVFLAGVEVIRSLGYAITEVDVPFASASFDIKNIEKDRKGLDVFMAVDVLLLPTTTDVTPTLTKAKK